MIFERKRNLLIRCLLPAICLLMALSSCSPARQTTRKVYKKAPPEFYQQHSEMLGFRLIGTEDPVLIREAAIWLGVPYRYGGMDRRGVDCSGFVFAVYQNAYGVQIPRSTAGQLAGLPKRNRSKARTGDLVFFRINDRKISHVGIYLGQSYFMHASTSRGVVVNSLDEPYYAPRYRKARKVP